MIVALACSAASASESRYVKFESSTPVVNVLYRYGHVDPGNAAGALGPNVTAPRNAWYIEEQRGGATDITAGVIRNDPNLIATGLHIFHFGLARQAKDGSFPGTVWPFHGPAMFLSEAGPAMVMLQKSQYASQFAGEIAQQIPLMRKAAYAMVRYVKGAGKIDDPLKNHRRFEAAIALGSVGKLTHDNTLIQWSTKYAWQGIHMQHKDGVMPENGGHDSGYQALGMINASRYLELVATGSLYTSLYHALQIGEAWEIGRVKSDGSINQAGDTRTAGCKETNPEGRCKTVFYAPIYSALARWSAISGDAHYSDVAHLVWVKSGYSSH
jgi:hypothetical protein